MIRVALSFSDPKGQPENSPAQRRPGLVTPRRAVDGPSHRSHSRSQPMNRVVFSFFGPKCQQQHSPQLRGNYDSDSGEPDSTTTFVNGGKSAVRVPLAEASATGANHASRPADFQTPLTTAQANEVANVEPHSHLPMPSVCCGDRHLSNPKFAVPLLRRSVKRASETQHMPIRMQTARFGGTGLGQCHTVPHSATQCHTMEPRATLRGLRPLRSALG